MCFSASASFITGSALLAVGAVTITKTKRKAEIPFAMIPLLFGVQQISEGLIWLSFRFDASLLNMAMTYVYSFFSHVLWPVFIPFAIGLLETVFWRKKIISGFQAIGIAVGLYFLYFIVGSPIASQVLNKSIVYISPHFYIIAIMAAYFVATIGSPLFSSSRIVNLFGALALLSAVVAYGFYAAIFVSVWCFFAAILSVVVLLYFICVCCIYHYSKHRL